MRRSLERSDTVINLRNQEIATLNSRLAAKDETIAEAAEQLDRLDQEVIHRSSQFEKERASREEVEAELSDLKQNSAPASELSEKTLPDAATILSHLRGKRKKTPVTLADIEAILEMME